MPLPNAVIMVLAARLLLHIWLPTASVPLSISVTVSVVPLIAPVLGACLGAFGYRSLISPYLPSAVIEDGLEETHRAGSEHKA